MDQGYEERSTKALLKEAENFKRLAFFGIAISTVATLTAIVAVPMLYNYMQYVQSSLEGELVGAYPLTLNSLTSGQHSLMT